MSRLAAGIFLTILFFGAWGAFLPSALAAQDIADFEGLPEGPGREEVYYSCQACHSLAIVVQQRLTRDSWQETLEWMVEEQGMPEPKPEVLAAILDYLGSRLSADTPR